MAMLLPVLVATTCSPAAAPDDTEPGREATPEPTVDPLRREISAEVECSSNTSVIEVSHDDVQISLEQLIDRAAVIAHASGVSREQIRFPESQPSAGEDQATCEWVVLADVEVMEYLKGQGPDTIRVALPVAEFPRPDRPAAKVGDRYDIEAGSEYVLFLDASRFTKTWDPSGRTWTVLFESHGRWSVEGESLLTRLEPPEDNMTLNELRTAISPLGPGVLPTVGPLGRVVGASTECSSDLAEPWQGIISERDILYVQLPLEELINDASLIVYARGVAWEQVNIPVWDPGYPDIRRRQPACEWVVFAEVEVKGYLKGDGPDTLRVFLREVGGPLPDRPLVRVKPGQDLEGGLEYVLFLQDWRFPDSWGLSGRYWIFVGGPQGRWQVVGEMSRTGLEPPLDEMTMDELRAAISSQPPP